LLGWGPSFFGFVQIGVESVFSGVMDRAHAIWENKNVLDEEFEVGN
jgi:hypothetical protein